MEVRTQDSNTARRLHILRECPKTFITSFSHDIIQLYMWSTQFNGALPEPGGLLDQNAVVMEALAVVHAEHARVQAWEAYEERKKHAVEREKNKHANK